MEDNTYTLPLFTRMLEEALDNVLLHDYGQEEGAEHVTGDFGQVDEGHVRPLSIAWLSCLYGRSWYDNFRQLVKGKHEFAQIALPFAPLHQVDLKSRSERSLQEHKMGEPEDEIESADDPAFAHWQALLTLQLRRL